MIERPRPCAAALERAHKRIRPPVHLVKTNSMGHVGLFGPVKSRVDGIDNFRKELAVYVVALVSGVEPEAAGVSDLGTRAEYALMELDPVVDYAELARLVIEEDVKVASYDLIYVEEKRRPLKSSKAFLKNQQLDIYRRPTGIACIRSPAGRRRREWLCVHALGEARRVVRNAHKAKRPVKMGLYTMVKPIDIIG